MVSGNRKTGPIPVSMTSSDSCPASCPFMKNGCYAGVGLTAIHWRRSHASLVGMGWDAFVKAVKRIPRNALWRHNAAGDLPRDQNGDAESIDASMLAALVQANQGRRGFTYTHRHTNPANLISIREANDKGFTVNLSANNPDHADRLAATGAGPVVCVLPREVDGNKTKTVSTPQGRRIVVCPATYRDETTCANCGLCQRADRSVIVGFPSHGSQFKKASAIASASTVAA